MVKIKMVKIIISDFIFVCMYKKSKDESSANF